MLFVGLSLHEPPWERRRLAGKLEEGAGFAGGDASAPRFKAAIRVRFLEVFGLQSPAFNPTQ